MYHWKNYEKLYPMMIISKTLTETFSLEKPENPETIPSNMVSQYKILSYSLLINIILKVIKCRLFWYHFRKR